MISRWFPLTLIAVVFAPGPLHAQQPLPNRPKERMEAVLVFDFSAGQSEKMYEDIEVLRRILDRKLTPLYPSIPSKGGRTDATNFGTLYTPIDANTGSLIVAQDARHQIVGQGFQPAAANQEFLLYGAKIPYPATIPLQSLEGIYLKGHGVVYTATLSSLHLSAKTEADSAFNVVLDAGVVQQVTEWDSIRRQVRNEKEKPKKPEASKPPSLSDVLLKVLADNGHHFSQLADNESLSIVLTVHEKSPASTDAKLGTGSPKAESKLAEAGRDADAQREADNLGMLGLLHLKQAKYGEALSAFQKLLELAKKPNEEADVRNILAQCYLGLGQVEKARAELEQVIALRKKDKEAKEEPINPAAALPVKLIVSAPKKLLDLVKEGKISFEDLRRQANVETLRFGNRR